MEEFGENMVRGCVLAFTQLLDLKDLYTGIHSTQLVQMALDVGQRLGVSHRETRDLEIGATLHDIGKVGIPDAILNKPSTLTAEEMSLLRKHPEYGWQVTHVIPGLQLVSLYILHHHERWDGGGYPAGLRGEQIPLGARIVSVVDAFAAMTTSRGYRSALPRAEAFRRLRADSGTQFDPQVVSCFNELAG